MSETIEQDIVDELEPSDQQDWHAANQQRLAEALNRVRRALEQYAQHAGRSKADANGIAETDAPAQQEEEPSSDLALDVLCRIFRLSTFERDVVMLCAGMELESSFVDLVARLQPEPTFSLAFAALPHPHWNALDPSGPLRHWRLIEVGKGSTLTRSPLRIDERILHFLTGARNMDERLAEVLEAVPPPEELAPSHRAIAGRMALAWSNPLAEETVPVLQLWGEASQTRREVAAAACALAGLRLWRVTARNLPPNATDIGHLLRLWDREALLGPVALLLEWDDMEDSAPAEARSAALLLERCLGPMLVSSRRRRAVERFCLGFEMERPTVDEQRAFWDQALGDQVLSADSIDRLIYQFEMSASPIRAAAADALARLQANVQDGVAPDEPKLAAALWESCRTQARPRLDDTVQRISSTAGWNDLVLPERPMQMLREIEAQVRHRSTVYGKWGFSAQGGRGLGIAALFSGLSGVGKTLAAEILSSVLKLDLYRIDLSTVVSKYIGETEKNLRRVFDAAEAGGAVLVFDEADALFGKRSEVKDSHDRYANIEVSYLLQRMEAYRGLAILTTNIKESLDPAFLRRLRFVVQFPFPDPAMRARIWERVFPPQMQSQGLDPKRLAQLNVAGGNIRNIALNAAFLAAEAGIQVAMVHLLQAARNEYAKLEKPLTEMEIRGWR